MSSPLFFLIHLIGGAIDSQSVLALAIIISTFILEDPTTIIVGVLAADGTIPVPLALGSLYAGIILGDIGMYLLGYLASTRQRLARYVDHDFIAPLRAWLETRFILTVFSARFIPGSRVPTYAASGFFRSPFSSFVMTAVIATSIWTTFLFSASYLFGSVTSAWLGPLRWGIACVAFILLFLIARHNLRAFRAKRNSDNAVGIRTP